MIIALSGKRKSGKTTSANLIKELNPDFIRLGFADALKHRLSELYDIPLKDLYDNVAKEKYRSLMQDHGEAARKENPDVWVNFVMNYFDGHPESNLIIDDLRYFNELKTLIAHKACIMQIFADERLRIARGMVKDFEIDNHASELEVATISAETITHIGGHTIYNNKTLDDLKNQLTKAINMHHRKLADQKFTVLT
jgi:dephospho-CoA kinase